MNKPELGLLLVHGFTATPATFRTLVPKLEALGWPYRLVTLRGHGATTPLALKGIAWSEWVDDVRQALRAFAETVTRICLVGHSMGGMLALHLALTETEKIDSLVVAGASPRTALPFGPGRPLHFLVPLLGRVIKTLPHHPVFADPALAQFDPVYRWFPTEALLQLFGLMAATGKILPQVRVPTLILHSRIDTVNAPAGAQAMFEALATPPAQKKLVWFAKTNHSLFMDCEQAAVHQTLLDYVQQRQQAHP